MNEKIEGKLLKKANTYISNMLTDIEKKEVDISLCFYNNYLIFSVISGDNFFGYKIPVDTPKNKLYKLKYEDLKGAFKAIKVKDEIALNLEQDFIEIKDNNDMLISTLKAESVNLLNFKEFDLNCNSFIEIYANAFYESVKINKIIAKKNDISFCDKICFKINDINMFIVNMDNNSCIINGLDIVNETKLEFNFAISNDNISFINKWNKSTQDNKIMDKMFKLNIENSYLTLQSKEEFCRIKIAQDLLIDSLIETILKIDCLKFEVLNSKNIKDISDAVIQGAKLLDDTVEEYTLDKSVFNEKMLIKVDKQSFVNIVKNTNELSNIGIAVNSTYTPIIINYMGGYLRTKIIFNIIK